MKSNASIRNTRKDLQSQLILRLEERKARRSAQTALEPLRAVLTTHRRFAQKYLLSSARQTK
jgi:hypothetical protein